MPIITDANVLIDYVEADITILALYSSSIEQIIIPEVIFDEVEQLTLADCDHYNLKVVAQDMAVLTQAATQNHGPLSFQDKVCLYFTKSLNNATCITNEKALKKFCEQQNIPVKRGLKLMIELVEHQIITADIALEVAQKISQNNPFFINEKVLADFSQKLASI